MLHRTAKYDDSTELQGSRVSASPSLRVWLTDRRSTVRPFVEGFAGISYIGHLPVGVPGVSGSDSGSGFVFGGGAGIDVNLSADVALEFGFEFSRGDFEISGIDIDEDLIGGHADLVIWF
jgi:hypothetical protein